MIYSINSPLKQNDPLKRRNYKTFHATKAGKKLSSARPTIADFRRSLTPLSLSYRWHARQRREAIFNSLLQHPTSHTLVHLTLRLPRFVYLEWWINSAAPVVTRFSFFFSRMSKKGAVELFCSRGIWRILWTRLRKFASG